MASLGQELKRERELRSVSLRDISEQTKIGLRHLQALEDDRLDLLPGKFLTKAILRSYARAIGADEDRILNKFHEEALIREEKSRSEERARPDAAAAGRGEARRKSRTLGLSLVALSISIIAFLYAFVLAPRRSAPVPGTEARSAAASPTAKDKAAAVPEIPPPTSAAVPAQEEGLRLEFEFDAPSWMHIKADGVVVYEGIREAGTTETVEAKTEVVLQTGNAGGFRLRINGRPARPLGQPGKVLTDVRISRDNLSQFLEPGK